MLFRLSAALLALTLGGCATGPQFQRSQLALPLAPSIDAEVRLTQHQMNVAHDTSIAGGAAGLQVAGSPALAGGGFAAGAAAGAIGALIDAGINAHRESVANDAVKPMREHLADLDIDALIYQSVDGLDKASFAETVRVGHYGNLEAVDEKTDTLPLGSNILVLTPSYWVSYNGETFTYLLSATVVDRARDARGKVVITKHFGGLFWYTLSQSETPNATPWGTLSGEQWRGILTQASNETVALLNYHIAHTMDKLEPTWKYDKLKVQVFQEQGTRVWVRSIVGLFSLPKTSLRPL